MPNRQGRPIQAPDYQQPRGLLPDSAGAIARPTGAVEKGISEVTEELAKQLGKFADEAAAIEGERAGKSAGLDPAFRPTDRITVRARAFDKAATETYADMLSARTQRAMRDVYEANKASPAGLATGLDKLQDELIRNDVFPEIEGAFRAKFATQRLAFEVKARDAQEADVKDRSRAALLENVNETFTTAAQIATADPRDPKVPTIVAAKIAETHNLLDKAAAGDVITAVQAGRLKDQATGSIALTATMEQAKKLSRAEDVAAFRDARRKEFGEGKLKFFDAGWYAKLDSDLAGLERARRTQGNAAGNELSRRLDDYVGRVAAGQTPPPGEWTMLVAAAGEAPDGARRVQLAEQKVTLATSLRGKSADDADALMRGLRAKWRTEGGVDTERGLVLDFGDKFVTNYKRAIATDPLGAAQMQGLVPQIAPLDLDVFAGTKDRVAATDFLAQQLAARAAQAKAVAATYETPPKFLQPLQKEQIKAIVDGGGDTALELAKAIVKGGGADAPAMLREVGGDAPLLAQAGLILQGGGSLSAARDALEAAKIRRDKGKVTEPNGKDFGAALRDEIGPAFMAQPEDGARVKATATAITQARLSRGNIDPASTEAREIYKRAAQEAAGAAFVDGVQYGGVGSYKPGWWTAYKVLVPPGLRADSLRDAVQTLRDPDLAALPVPPQGAGGQAYSAKEIAGAVPVAVRSGNGIGYRFALGDPNGDDPKFIRGADGRPFVLPWDTVEPLIRGRVPRAFLGAR